MATQVDLIVPDIGDFHDVPVIEVLIEPGQVIAKEAPLVTLESEKATMEVPASVGGVVASVRVHVGDKVSQGTVLASVELAESGDAASAAPAPAAPAATAPPPGGASPAPPPAATAGGAPSAAPPATAAPPQPTPTIGPVHASPGIRRFARELGVDLSRVRGTGPNARVTREDVQGFVKRTLTESPATNGAGPALGSGLSLAPWPKVDYAQYGPVERVPLSRIKKLSAANLHRNWVLIPHVTQHEEADVTELEAFRKTVNAEQHEAKVTMLAFVLKAAVAALVRYPEFNAALEGDGLVLRRYYHLGFAADTPGGLVVPVVRDVDKKGIFALARETAELAAKARDGKLSMAEMAGGTFTVSSLGGIGGTAFTPIVNAPEVAILGLSRSSVRPVWDGSAFVPRTILPLSLSYDHRVIDGAAAARFCVFLARALADIRRTLL